MTHATQQHGGWARQARRRGEEYRQCNTCGQRAHPRLVVRQAIHVPPAEPNRWQPYAAATLVLLGALALIAQAGPA